MPTRRSRPSCCPDRRLAIPATSRPGRRAAGYRAAGNPRSRRPSCGRPSCGGTSVSEARGPTAAARCACRTSSGPSAAGRAPRPGSRWSAAVPICTARPSVVRRPRGRPANRLRVTVTARPFGRIGLHPESVGRAADHPVFVDVDRAGQRPEFTRPDQHTADVVPHQRHRPRDAGRGKLDRADADRQPPQVGHRRPARPPRRRPRPSRAAPCAAAGGPQPPGRRRRRPPASGR